MSENAHIVSYACDNGSMFLQLFTNEERTTALHAFSLVER